jgi:glyoxylase-like metal-dependent hydrolase (beta-lactamase superfamily II)
MGAEFPLPRAGQLIHRLEAAGIDLASVTDVVITHMHMDHVGGLLVDGVKDQLRPDLRIHVAAVEVKFWESPISPASPCRRASRTRFGIRPNGS